MTLVIDAQGVLQPRSVTPAGGRLDTLAAWLDALAGLAPERLSDWPPSIGHLNTVRLMALHLLAQGAVLPQLFAPDARTLGLRWGAAELDTTVRAMVQRLADTLPPDLVLQQRGRKLEPLSAPTQARGPLSGFIDTLLRRWAATSTIADKATRSREDTKVMALFFGLGQACLDGPGEGAIGGSIQTWLSRLHLGAQAYRPVLRIDEADGEEGFSLSLAVVDERSSARPADALGHGVVQGQLGAAPPGRAEVRGPAG